MPLEGAREAWSVRQSHKEQYLREVWFNKETAITRVDELKARGVREANYTRIAVIMCPDGKWRRISFDACNIHDYTKPKLQPGEQDDLPFN